MWKRLIEIPDHEISIEEIADILKGCLNETELEDLCEELLGWPSKGFEVLDEFEYWNDS